MRAFAVVLALWAGAAVAQDVVPLSDEARAECEAAGGQIGQRITMAELCIRPAADAGKTCASNADCESFCLAETATCGDWVPLLGCHEVLAGEGQSVTLCLE